MIRKRSKLTPAPSSCFPPAVLFSWARSDRPGWYIADAEMRDILGVVYISKRAAVVTSEPDSAFI
jgi:hypothetical protein